jgi:hypothetical protein
MSNVYELISSTHLCVVCLPPYEVGAEASVFPRTLDSASTSLSDRVTSVGSSVAAAASSFELTARLDSCSTEARVASVAVGNGTLVPVLASVASSLWSSSSASIASSSCVASWRWLEVPASSDLRAYHTNLDRQYITPPF